MAADKAVPVVVGVGDVINRSSKAEDAIEPMQLMLQAIHNAIKDTGVPQASTSKLRSKIDSIDVVRTWTWPYTDLPGLLAEQLQVHPHHKHYSDHGGNSPAKLFDAAARRLSTGESKVAVLCGGEALASLSACVAAKKIPPPGWTKIDQTVGSVFSPTTRELATGTSANALLEAAKPSTYGTDALGLGATHGIGAPIQVYPLYENGFRAHRGQSIKENHQESARLYAEFAEVAEKNSFAWSHGKLAGTEESIAKVTKKNRMICFPYPLLMNAFNTVNLAAACILTTTDYARELGIPENRWIYPLGGAGTRDSDNFWERPNFHSSPSISHSLDAALEVSGISKDQVDLYDFYSCFPIVPKLASQHLGLPVTGSSTPTTLLGGLTSFGGAGNNYSMHAITAMVRQLRQPGRPHNGLILANGGVVTYQHVIILSSSPRRDGTPYPARDPLPPVLTPDSTPSVDAQAEGEAVIETYTLDYSRSGAPTRGHVVGRLLRNGHRFLANHGDERTLQELGSWTREQVGRRGYVRTDSSEDGNGRNLFSLVFEGGGHGRGDSKL
ncbi:hypothetical protein H2203_001780 [Taxawa tesnikishii (nom. ined.)]|nr:hypothetical protein H2203_001780 [Dothideales sp. JES 119]